MTVDSKKKSRFKVPHTYVILAMVILIMAVLTFVVPAGQYDRVKDEATGKTIVISTSYQVVESNPISFFGLFKSIPKGMKDASGIIFFIFIVGGAFQIITATGAIEAGIGRMAKALQGKEKLMIPAFLFIFSLGGATFGMAEETIIFVPIGIALARALGFDALTGTAMIILGAGCGFTAGFMNPFTVGVAQNLCELPLFSGAVVRVGFLVVFLAVTMVYLIRYSDKVRKDPTKSLIYEIELQEKDNTVDMSNLPEMTTTHKLVLMTVVVGFGFIIYGVFKNGWYITEIGSAFLAMGIIGGFIGRLNADAVAQEFVNGAKSIVFGALVVGVARAILVVMKDGMILDTIIHGLAAMIQSLPNSISAIGMYITQVIINFFIPSGSGQAAATMPIMKPLADIVGITRQTAVVAYQLGDGFTNSIIPTSASLMAALSIAKIPYEKWFKFLWPLMSIWIGLGAIIVIASNLMNFGPF